MTARRGMTILSAGLAVACLLRAAQAGEESVGALFLDEPVGARPAALGEAMAAVAEDVNTVYWNPAGLARIGRREMLLTHTQSYLGFRNEYLALAWPWSEQDAFAFNALVSYSDGFEKYSDAGELLGSYSVADLYAGLTWSHAFDSAWSAGLTLTGLRSAIDTYTAWSAAANLGVLWRTPVPDLTAGLTVRNLGKPLVFISENHALNLSLEAGAAYRTWNQNLLLAFALRKPVFQEMEFKFGSEYVVQDLVCLRAGYRYWQFGNDLGPLAGLTVGLGLRISDYDLDYAYTPFPDVGDVHRISVVLPFGRSAVEEQRILEKLEKQVKAKQQIVFAQTMAEGDRWASEKEWEKAQASYGKAFGMNPNDNALKTKMRDVEAAVRKETAARHAARGRKAMQEKDYLTALVEWSKVLELSPRDATAQKMVSEANLKLSAEKLSSDATQEGRQIERYFQQGLQHLKNGRYGTALEIWKKILTLDPGNTRVIQYLKLTQSKVDDLVEDLLRLADRDWGNGQYLNAVKKWRQVLDISGGQPRALACLTANRTKLDELADQYYRRGVEQYIQNDLDAAVVTWQNVIMLDPNNEKALRHLDQVKKKRKDLLAIQE